MRCRIAEIEIDLAADEIVNHDVFARRTKSQSSLIFEDMTGVLELIEIEFVEVRAFALQVRAEISPHMRAFIPIKAEPLQSFINCGHGFFGIARPIGVLNAQNEFPPVMPREKPVKKRSACPANVQISSRRGGEADANVRRH